MNLLPESSEEMVLAMGLLEFWCTHIAYIHQIMFYFHWEVVSAVQYNDILSFSVKGTGY